MSHLQPWQWGALWALIALLVGLGLGRLSLGGRLVIDLDRFVDEERRKRIWAGVLMAASIYVQNHPDLQQYTPALVAMGVMSKGPGGKS